MLRVLALLCSFALLLAPLGTAQAKPAGAVLACLVLAWAMELLRIRVRL